MRLFRFHKYHLRGQTNVSYVKSCFKHMWYQMYQADYCLKHLKLVNFRCTAVCCAVDPKESDVKKMTYPPTSIRSQE